MSDLPSPRPPQRWEHGGKVFYFGHGDPPPGTEAGSLAEYTRYYREEMLRFSEQLGQAEANMEAEKKERLQREASLMDLPFSHDAPLKTGDPSPFNPAASVRLYTPQPSRPAPTMHDDRSRARAPSFELTIQENQADAVQMDLRIFRISPDRGDLGDVNLFENLGEMNTLGGVRAYLLANHYDGRCAIFQVRLLIDGEEEGPWSITLPKDPERIARAEIDREANLRAYRRERNLPDLPQALGATAPPAPAVPPPPPAPMPVPQGGFFTAEQAAMMIATAIEELKRQNAPKPPPNEQPAQEKTLYTPEEVRKMIAEEIAKTQPAQPAQPAAPAEPPKSALEQVKESLHQAQETISTVKEITGGGGDEDDIDPTIDKNGISIPKELFKSDPKTALFLANGPVAMSFLGGIKEAAKELMHENAKLKKEELANRAEELRNEERAVELQRKKVEILERAKRLNGGDSEPEPEERAEPEPRVVESSDWAPPRNRRTKANGS